MCSICGIADFYNPESLDIKTAENMNVSLKHRGPDDTDISISDNVIFCHNRLSVIDPKNGHQPMTAVYEGKKYTIVYNGEIYNTAELKAELSKYGIKFKTACDTEVVLYSYIIYGDKCPEILNGIFAFAVYDEDKKRLFLARDRFGIKPFFYAVSGTSFIFASEVKAILKHPKITAQVDKYGIWQLLFLTPVTLGGSGVFRNVSEIKPAYCGYFNKNGLFLRKYWELKVKPFKETAEEAAQHVKYLMTDAVNRQLISDVPLCTFLSGGLDSSVITSIAAQTYKKEGKTLSTYSFEYEGNKKNFKSSLFQPKGDDEFAVYLADYLKTDHTVLTAPTKAVAQYLIDATLARDLPGQADIDSSLLYFCRRVKEEHTTALSGECSDEIFGGYPWFYRPEMLYRDFFPWIHEPFARINLFREDFARPKEGYDYISQIYKNTVNECPVLEEDSDAMKTSRIATVLCVDYFMTSLLERKDRMSMASGLEVRVPFADHRILEYVYNVPWEIKFENGVEKALLRNAMREYLPDKILYRKKSPYPKTHNPLYEKIVTEMLEKRLKNKTDRISEFIDKKKLSELLGAKSVTWFGQLMSKPQLIAWLIQFDCWLTEYNVEIV